MIVPPSKLPPLNKPPPDSSEPPDEARPVLARLARLRSLVAVWFWTQGLARVLWLCLVIFAADLAVDWLFRLDRPQRAIMLAIMLAAIGVSVYRWLWQPLSTQLSDDALALAIESAHPRLGQSFVTALQLIRVGAASRPGVSPILVRRTVEIGFRQAQEISFASVVDRRRWRQNLAVLAAAGVIWLSLLPAMVALWPLRTWLSRNLLLQNSLWPQQTYLAFADLSPDGTIIAPRGAAWSLELLVTPKSRVVPPAVVLEFRVAAGRAPLPLKQIADRRFAVELAAASEPFAVRARGGDATTDWTPVELVEPPALSQLRLIVAPSRYTGAEPAELAPGEGPYAILPGSTLQIEGRANKPLARATLHSQGELLLPEAPSPQKPDTPPHAASAATELLTVPRAVFDTIITPDLLIAGEYRLELTDTLGLASREPVAFVLRRRIDQAPQLQATLIGIGDLVTPEAVLAYRCRASDDFGLPSACVRYRCQTGEESQAQAGQWPLSAGIPLAANSRADSSLPPTELDLEGTLPLAGLKLAPGTIFTFHFEAADNNDVTGPGVGRTSEMLLRVVSPDELKLDVLRREKEQRQSLERSIKDQEDLLADSRALAATWNADPAATGAIFSEFRTELRQAEQRQTSIGSGVAAIAQSIRGLAAEVRNNHLEEARGPLQSRLIEEVARPLEIVASEAASRAVAALGEARQSVPGNSPHTAPERALARALERAIAAQSQAAQQLKAVLAHMAQAESFAESVQLLRNIEKAQSQVHEATSQARQEQIRRLLEGPGGTK